MKLKMQFCMSFFNLLVIVLSNWVGFSPGRSAQVTERGRQRLCPQGLEERDEG